MFLWRMSASAPVSAVHLYRRLVLGSLLPLFLAGCSGGGGNAGSTGATGSVEPTVTAVSVSCAPTSVHVTQTSQCTANVSGTGNYSSAVTWSVDSGAVSSTGLYTAPANAPSSGGATIKATSTQDSSKSGSATISISPAVSANGSLVIMATPAGGGSGNGPWELSIAARDSSGNPLSGTSIALSASEGTLTPAQGTTDANGLFSSTITPPSSYNDEAVAVSASAAGQTAAVDIVFSPYSFNSPSAKIAKNPHASGNASTGTSAMLTSPFVFGTSASSASSVPWLTPNTCYSNVNLGSTVPANCAAILSGNGLSQLLPNAANVACKAAGTLIDLAGQESCVGVAATVISCLASETGVGAVICAGGLAYSQTLSSLCVGYLTGVLEQAISSSKTDQAGMNETIAAAGVEGSSGLTDIVGNVCDEVEASVIGQGTGTGGTKVTVSPPRAIAVIGSSVQFTAQTSDKSAVNWSVNGVLNAASQSGSITADGLFTAPSSVPILGYVTVSATSQSDPTATAPAIVQILPAPPGTITTVAGTGKAGSLGDDAAAVDAQLSDPSGLAFDGAGNLFIADTANNVIREVAAATQTITTIAGTHVAGYGGDGYSGVTAELNQPTHVVFDRTFNLYITDANNERIRKVYEPTGVITTVAGNGTQGSTGDDGPATDAELNFPDGVAIDSNGNLYIGDAQNNRIREVAIASGTITTVAGNGVPGYSGDGELATNAELNFPSRPFIDATGNIYIADYQNNRVRKVSTTGIITTIAGTGVAGYAGDGGSAASAELNGPLSVAVDSAGIIYIADVHNERIRAVNPTSNPVTVLGTTIQPGQIQTVVGNGQAGYNGDGGAATNAEIDFPTGLTIDSTGNLYFADAYNNVVRKVVGQ